MKKYLADILIALRLICAIVILILYFVAANLRNVEIVFWAFVVGELTNALDVVCVRKWPFPPECKPKYRECFDIYDAVAGILLGISAMLFLREVSPIYGSIALHASTLSGVMIEITILSCFFSAYSDDYIYSKDSLDRGLQKIMPELMLLCQCVYLACIGLVIVRLFMLMCYEFWVKALIILVAITTVLILLYIKQDRLHEIKS